MCGWTGYNIGNLSECSIEELWQGEKAEEFRQSLIDGSYRYCKKDSCPYLANEILEEILTDYKVPDYPKYCSLSYEEQCNYVCKFCRTKKYIPTKKEKEGIQKIEKEIYKFAGQLDNLSSNGVGEIFCSPSILDFLHNVKFNKNIKIGLESNGSLFNERNWLKISNLGMYNLEVMITVHSFEESTYQFLSGTNLPLSNVIKNLCFIKGLREKGMVKRFEIATVVCERNFRELPDFVEKCLEFNPDSIRLRFFEPYGVGNRSDEWFYDIRNSNHPYYEEFKRIIRHPILQHPKVWKWQGETISKQKEHPYFDEQKKTRVLSELVTIEDLGEKLKIYLDNNQINRLALYGNGLVGQAFASFLGNNHIEFGNIFDSFAQGNRRYKGHKICKPCESSLKEYDLIIITSAFSNEIVKLLTDFQYMGDVLTLEDILSEVR